MAQSKAVNFKELVTLVRTKKCRQGDIAIWGGTCAAAKLYSFVEQWMLPGTNMPYCIWEYISEIEFTSRSLFKMENIDWLQRGRLFGGDGDLELRRQGDMFTWRFVGIAGIHAPEGYAADNFWVHESTATFHHYPDQQALLWGEWSPEISRWFDDRVAIATLTYPIADTPHRVVLEYDIFSRNGIVEYVWFKRLVGWKEGNYD